MSASKVLVNAYISDRLSWGGDEQHLIGLVNRMRLFAPRQVIAEAEAVIGDLVHIAQQPKLKIEELARTTLTDRFAPDLLLSFSLATQADLGNVYWASGGNRSKIAARAMVESVRDWLLPKIVSIGTGAMSTGTRTRGRAA